MSTPVNYTEPELLRLIAEGNEPAFRILYDKYHVKIFDYLIVITKAKEAAEEIVADIFLKLWMGREWIAEINNLEAFLKKVAYNKAIDFMRHTARNKKMQAIIAREMNQEADDSLMNVLLERDYQRIIQEAVNSLSPQRRLVFTMSRYRGLTHDEIARELNLSINTVSNHTKEALKSIRTFLKKNDIPGISIFFF